MRMRPNRLRKASILCDPPVGIVHVKRHTVPSLPFIINSVQTATHTQLVATLTLPHLCKLSTRPLRHILSNSWFLYVDFFAVFMVVLASIFGQHTYYICNQRPDLSHETIYLYSLGVHLLLRLLTVEFSRELK